MTRPATYQPADPTTTFYSPEPEITSASQVQTTDKPAPVTTTKGTTLPETTVAADTTAHTETTQRPVAVSTVTTSVPEKSITTVKATPRDETTISEEILADETTTRRRQSSLETTTTLVEHYDTSTEADQAVEETTLGQVAVDSLEAKDVQENEIEDHTTTSAGKKVTQNFKLNFGLIRLLFPKFGKMEIFHNDFSIFGKNILPNFKGSIFEIL